MRGKDRPKKPTRIEQEQQYVEFLRRRIESEHFRAQATPEEMAITKEKYDKAKFRLRMLKGSH